ncbi:MAG: RrF2 family transcriptional regulator [Gemmataceae bacterium]
MISKPNEYALRAVVYLAMNSSTPQTTEQIARATKAPQAYLAKILQFLSRAGIVRSQRGVGGGMVLLIPTKELTILDVVNAVDPVDRILTCPLEIAAHGVNLCPLHARLDTALQMVEDAFRQTTLADILAKPTQGVPLCDFPTQVE